MNNVGCDIKPTYRPRKGYRWVRLKAQWVDSDGDPVNANGITFGRGWRKAWHWEWRERKIKKARPR